VKFLKSVLILIALQVTFISARSVAASLEHAFKHKMVLSTEETQSAMSDCESVYSENDENETETNVSLLPSFLTNDLLLIKNDRNNILSYYVPIPVISSQPVYLLTGKLTI
jgi:hypothetical protein